MMNAKPSPVSASTLYTSTLLHAYPRVTTLADSIYSPTAYANAQGYLSFTPTADSSAFYAPLNAECGDAWRNLTAQTAAAAAAAAAWVYEPSMVGYPYPASYGNLDVRRKNATRESTSTLKAWLYEHIKNPYPTKGEKIMLAIITKMTLTQVSTWFANARRRLKKENKMQWSPRNRTGDDDDDDDDKNSDNDDVIIGEATDRDERSMTRDDDEDIIVDAGNDDDDSHSGFQVRDIDIAPSASRPETETSGYNIRTLVVSASNGSVPDSESCNKDGVRDAPSTGSAVEKPRIWSLADVATSSTPPGVCRKSPTTELPVKVNELLGHHRFAQQSPVALSTSGSIGHHGFQPWTKRFLPTVHPFANKLIPSYTPFGHHPITLGAQTFRQDPCAVTCNDTDAARSHAPITANSSVSGNSLLSPAHRLDFSKRTVPNGLTSDLPVEERTSTSNATGRFPSLSIFDHPPPAMSSSTTTFCPSSSSSSSSSSSYSSSSPPVSSSSSSSSFSPALLSSAMPSISIRKRL